MQVDTHALWQATKASIDRDSTRCRPWFDPSTVNLWARLSCICPLREELKVFQAIVIAFLSKSLVLDGQFVFF